MKRFLWLFFLLLARLDAALPECVVYDDGTGAQIDYTLPLTGQVSGSAVEYSTFRLLVTAEDKILLLTDLPGRLRKEEGSFAGSIIIPSSLIKSARIILLGGPPNSSRGVSTELKVADFPRSLRKLSWIPDDK